MFILGISAYYHDSASCLIKNEKIIAAVQEERFTRKKHDSSFPINAIEYCIQQAKINSKDIDYVVFYEKPFLKFERLLETTFSFAPQGFKNFRTSMPIWIKEKLFQKYEIIRSLQKIDRNVNWKEKLLFSEHHLSHASSAFFPSPFEEAAILTVDGVGEWSTTSLGVGKKNNIEIFKEINFPHSLGLLYSAFTYYTGFKVNSGEYKLMGLAPYGKAKYVNLIKKHLIEIKEDGSFKLNMKYFDFCTNLKMTSSHFHELFGQSPRKPETNLTKRDMDLAASIQVVTQEVIIKLAKTLARETGKKNLCLAGGVALNCVANGLLHKEKMFENIWIQPASGDAGGSLGAALNAFFTVTKSKRVRKNNKDIMQGSFLGPCFKSKEIRLQLNEVGANFEKLKFSDICSIVAKSISHGSTVGWMSGRMEFGPRALGARSIIADPRSKNTQKNLNLKIKFRESFRPFAPSVLKEYAKEWFELDTESPYMLLVSSIKEEKKVFSKKLSNLNGFDKLNVVKSEIPAVTHVDYSARFHTVDKISNPNYYKLLNEFFKITGCPVLVNTSFNVRGEPIVCNPKDAFRCFMATNLDILVIENYIMYKKSQKAHINHELKTYVELD